MFTYEAVTFVIVLSSCLTIAAACWYYLFKDDDG